MKKLLRKKKEITVNEALKLNIDPHSTDRFDAFSSRAKLMMMIMMAISIIGLLGVYTGYVNYHAGQAGYIYELIIQFEEPDYNWGAIYGASFGVGVSQQWSFTVDPGGTSEENIFFDCFENGIEHEIYASTIPEAQLDMANLQPATIQDIDDFIGITNFSYDSALNTFTTTISVEYGATQINNIPATHTYVGTGTSQTAFDIGILKDGNDEIVMVAHVFENLTAGFNDRFYNFQMLLPIPNNASVDYYLFSDPNDICLGGSQSPNPRGIVTGNVTDISGNFLEDVIIVVGEDSTVTDVNGLYEVTADAGETRVLAIKTGYEVYVSLLNVTANNITYHNIVLDIESVPNLFTGIGPDDNPGEDDPGTDQGPGEVDVQLQSPTVIEGQDYVIALNEINKRMRLDEFAQERVYIYSYKPTSMQINVELTGSIAKIGVLDKTRIIIPSRSDDSFTITFFANDSIGIYNGTINISGDISAEIPVTIEILDKEKIPVQAMLIGLSAPSKTLYAGSRFTFRTDLTNLLTDRQYPVRLFYTIQNLEGTETVWSYQTNVFLKTSMSLIKNVDLPNRLPVGDYVVRVSASYLDLSGSASMIFPVSLPFLQYILFGNLRVWHALLILLGLLLAGLAAFLIKRNIEAKKKYHLKVEMSEIPKEGPRSILVGKIAETDHKAYLNIDNFKTHTIDAGSTGGGKSFSAQVIIEEMLLKDIAVIVFDPTAQWTGMLRKLTNKGLLSLYSSYGLKPSDAKAFKGNIRQINNPRELIDIRAYMKPGEIQVFAVHKLDPKDIDIFVANTVRQVFHANFDESEPLKLMLVYDEVHRLLPKFGGSGEGFLQIERACREFRKWGIGVMLISQVLADFVGQIKANINTEIQMRTRDEGDLDRIKTKYGEGVLRSLVKASVGTGMVQNAAYNRGKPYFVTFRPIMHSVARLSDDEIAQYNTYNEKISQISYELEQLEELKQDVFDLKLELKLALDKVKQGNFNMGKIYLEGLEPSVIKFWDKLGKKPKKLEIMVVSEEELKEEMKKAEKDREAYEKKQSKAGASSEEKEIKFDPVENFGKDVPLEKILKLHNDMLVVSPKSLYSEIEAMKDSDFDFHVDKDKNDFSTWIRDAVGDKELGDLIDQETKKAAILKLLDMREKGEKLPALEIKKKPVQVEEIPEKEDGAEVEKELFEKPKKQEELVADRKESFEEFARPAEDKDKVATEAENKSDESGKPSVDIAKFAPENKYFKLDNGVELKSIQDLVNYLPTMPDDIFSKHVDSAKNDFASWIKHVFEESELADKVSHATTKSGLEEVLVNA